jgi:Rrf2 family protein
MLRFSKKTDYALIALKDLALSPAGISSSAREIAGKYDIPVRLMAKVLSRLAKRGLLASHQGTQGGYHLARPATLISVADVIQAIEGPVMLTACSDADESCDQYCKCNVRDPLWRLQDRIVQSLAAFTIQELASDDAPGPFALSVTARPAPGSAVPPCRTARPRGPCWSR